ncbi:MAG TPA: addiction module protein [Nitriliruptorales bacterium]
MTDNASTVLREALALPADERAHIAADLINSLDERHGDADEVAVAWADEFEHRARQTLQDPSSGQDWGRVRDRIAGRLTNE